MFEARLTSSAVLKKVLDAIKDLLNEATFDCSDSGIQVNTTSNFLIFPWTKNRIIFVIDFWIAAASHGQFTCVIGIVNITFRWIWQIPLWS